MNPILRAFLSERCIPNPAAVTQLKDLLGSFRATLPPKVKASWPRQRFVSELARGGFVIGEIDRVAHIAGISLRGQWREVNGRLELAAHA